MIDSNGNSANNNEIKKDLKLTHEENKELKKEIIELKELIKDNN